MSFIGKQKLRGRWLPRETFITRIYLHTFSLINFIIMYQTILPDIKDCREIKYFTCHSFNVGKIARFTLKNYFLCYFSFISSANGFNLDEIGLMSCLFLASYFVYGRIKLFKMSLRTSLMLSVNVMSSFGRLRVGYIPVVWKLPINSQILQLIG